MTTETMDQALKEALQESLPVWHPGYVPGDYDTRCEPEQTVTSRDTPTSPQSLGDLLRAYLDR